jgi:hypothetical protein
LEVEHEGGEKVMPYREKVKPSETIQTSSVVRRVFRWLFSIPLLYRHLFFWSMCLLTTVGYGGITGDFRIMFGFLKGFAFIFSALALLFILAWLASPPGRNDSSY